MLTGLGSKMNTPHSDSTSTHTNTPGKIPLALPSSENERIFQNEYEVEEVADNEMAEAPLRF